MKNSDREENSISLPQNWEKPKYQLGQVTASGIIVGLQYCPLGFGITLSPEPKWHYLLVEDFDGEDVLEFSEEAIEPLSLKQATTNITIDIEYCLEKLYLLVEQLKIARKQHDAE